MTYNLSFAVKQINPGNFTNQLFSEKDFSVKKNCMINSRYFNGS